MTAQKHDDQPRVAATGDSRDSRTAAGNQPAPAPDPGCRRCYEPKAKHLVVKDQSDWLAPPILLCPTATYDTRRWYDK